MSAPLQMQIHKFNDYDVIKKIQISRDQLNRNTI